MADGFRYIDEVWAWVALDPTDNTEGIPAMQLGDMAFPLVGADRERMESFRPSVKHMVDSGQVEWIELRRYVSMEIMERVQK